MSHSTRASGGVYLSVVLITVVFILLGSFASNMIAAYEPFLVLGMLLLLGLPHGATDHGLFLALRRGKPAGKKIRFYLAYGSVIAAYGLIWYFLPLLAFAIFILLSVYHFGQSNWVNVKHKNGIFARGHYLLWGVGILLTPILLHAEEAIAIVATMTDTVISTPQPSSVLIFIASVAALNVVVTFFLRLTGTLSTRRLIVELLTYSVLLGMFFTNSLLLGFTVYFVFWHSLTSARDQYRFFERRLSPELRRQLYSEIAMTVAGAFIFCLIVWFGPGPEAALSPSIIGGVFIAISLLTMPHMLLVEQLYTSWSPEEEIIKEGSLATAVPSTHINITKPQSVSSTSGW